MFLFSHGSTFLRILSRDVFLVVCQVLCAKVVDAMTSRLGLSNLRILSSINSVVILLFTALSTSGEAKYLTLKLISIVLSNTLC